MDVECSNIASLNRALESGCDLPSTIWDKWLWKCDLAEPVTPECMMNKMHLLGLLIARYRALKEPSLVDVCLSLPDVVNFQTNVATLTPRQLKDVVDCMQMHWSRYTESVPTETLIENVDACMARFGMMNLKPCVYDDVNMRDPLCEHRMNQPTIRRFVSIFCVLYRHIHMDHFATEPVIIADSEQIQDCHVQASQDTFFKLAMHSDLPPAARFFFSFIYFIINVIIKINEKCRLLYRQDFSGFYHNISQVVYFHYPSYERPDQLSISALRDGVSSAVSTLAPVCEMYPEINVCFEDDIPSENSWNWVLMGKRVFLLRPDGSVLGSPNILVLLGAFVAETTTTTVVA
jgi:hypothetical protein